MFIDENKMKGLSLLYESPNIESVLNWGKTFYRNNNIFVTIPIDGSRHFEVDLVSDHYQYPSLIIQENKRYKVYG